MQASGPDDEGAEADAVEARGFGVLDVGRIDDEAVDHEQGEDADGDVDVEGIAPGVGVGEPAAEGGAEDGCDDDSEGEDCHGCSAFAGWEGFEQDGLGEGLERSAAGALNYASEEQKSQGGGRSAGEGGGGEDGDAGHEETLASETEGEPVAGGEDDGVGDEVGGEDPGGFVDGGGEGAGDVRESDGGDGGVEHLHESGEHDGGRDEPGIYAATYLCGVILQGGVGLRGWGALVGEGGGGCGHGPGGPRGLAE